MNSKDTNFRLLQRRKAVLQLAASGALGASGLVGYIGRALAKGNAWMRRPSAAYEYLRALRYELKMLPQMDRIQMCSQANEDYLLEFVPELKSKMQTGLRAGIDTSRYNFNAANREPNTLLFLGSFRHIPNREALEWFIQYVWPLIVQAKPETRLIIIGSDPPPRHSLPEIGHVEIPPRRQVFAICVICVICVICGP